MIHKIFLSLYPQTTEGPSLNDLRELYDIVSVDLKNSLKSLMGVANDVITQSHDIAMVLDGSRQAFAVFTKV